MLRPGLCRVESACTLPLRTGWAQCRHNPDVHIAGFRVEGQHMKIRFFPFERSGPWLRMQGSEK
jgi:hypothetical protein